MKKLLWTVAALAALSFAVIGCQNPGDATASTDSTGTTQNTGDNSGGNASGSGSNNQANAENKDNNTEKQESGGDQTGDGTSTAAKDYTVWLSETSKVYTAGAEYGQIVLYNDADKAFSVGAGDWLIVNTTVKFENIGQTYASLGFTKTDATEASYISLNGFYTKETGTSSTDYYVIYKFSDAGKVHYVSFNNGAATGSGVNALSEGSEVTLENLKLVHVASDKVDTVFTKIVKEDSVDVAWEGGTTNAYQYAPTVNFDIKTGSKLSVVYTRPELSDSYKSHYVNSGLGWNATYPAKDAQTISISIPVTEDKTINWLQVGIQCKTADSADSITFTNLEIRIIPGMDSFN